MTRFLQITGLLKQVRKVKQTATRSLSTTFNLLAYQRQVLTDEEVNQYHTRGYIVLRELLTPQEKKDIVRYCDEVQEWPEVSGKYFKYHEHVNGKKVISRYEYFYHFHEGLKGMVEGKLGAAVADLCGEPVVVFKDKINFKMAGGIGYAPHQDEPSYDMFKQGLHLTALITADPMDKNNGCLSMVPGNWQEGNWLKLNQHGDIDEEIADKFEYDDIEADAGTVVLFNSIIPHKSNKNNTDKARRAYYITWNGVSRGDRRDEFYSLRRVMFPQDHERDPNKDYSEGVKLFSEQILEMGKGNIENTYIKQESSS